MPNDNTKKFSPLFPFLAAVICVALSYLYISPTISEVNELNASIEAKDTENAALEEKLSDLNVLATEFEQSESDLQFYNISLPTSDDLENFLVQASTMADESSISLESVTPAKKSTNTITNVEISVAGNYENLLNFISNLENNSRLANIESIDINSSSTLDLAGYVDAKIQVGLLKVDLNE